MEKEYPLQLLSFLFLFAVLGPWINSTLDCDNIVYSTNWSIEHLREVVSYCGNGN